jgi:hypothetical protein
MSFILVSVSKRIATAEGGGGEGGDDDDDLLATLEFVFAAGVLNAKEGDVIRIPMLTAIVAIIKKIITDTLNIINERFSG